MRTAWHTLANLFRGSDLKIGVRLTTCFLTIVVLMIAGDAVSIWQLRQLEAHTQMLKTADKASSAIVRLHLDVNSFSGRVAVLTRGHDARQFANEAALLRETFLRHVRDAEQILNSSSEIAQDAFTSSTLKTLKATLPTQIDSEIELANAGDWPAIQLRLTGQIQDLIDLSSSLVEGVEERAFQQRASSERTDRAGAPSSFHSSPSCLDADFVRGRRVGLVRHQDYYCTALRTHARRRGAGAPRFSAPSQCRWK